MLGFCRSSERVKEGKPKVPNYYIHRDELDKKPSPRVKDVGTNKADSASKPLSKNSARKSNSRGQEKEGLKVKILMTKEEAARLLSKCKDGGILEFKDVARELVQIPMNRVSVVSPSTSGSDHSVLESIHEELLDE